MNDKNGSDRQKEPCRHLRLMKERILGSQTGDYNCLDCGEQGIAPCDLPKLNEGEERSYS